MRTGCFGLGCGMRLRAIGFLTRPAPLQAFSLINPAALSLSAIKVPGSLSAVDQRVMRSLADVVASCTAANPHARPTAAQLVLVLEEIVKANYLEPRVVLAERTNAQDHDRDEYVIEVNNQASP
jgi:hypothetical protein